MHKLLGLLSAALLLVTACGSSSDDPDSAAEVEAALDNAETPSDGDEGAAIPDGAETGGAAELPGADEVTITVNGVSLDGAGLMTRLDEWALAFASDETATVRAGDGFDPAFVAFVLTQYVQLEAVLQAADSLGFEADDANRESAADALAGQLPDLPSDGSVYGQVLEVQAILLSLEPDDDEIAEYFDQNPDLFPPVLCSRHILHDTVGDAEATLARLDDGEDFAALAAEVSTGPSGPSGGDLGCVPEGSFVPDFEAAAYGAEPGETVGPVGTEFGFHVIEVISVGPPALADVRDQIVTEVSAVAAEPLTQALASAAVEIDPRLGAWDPATAQVSVVR